MTSTSASILVVDDEPPLRRLMQTYLERIGYIVKTSHDAASALACLAESPGEFGIVVIDLSLPDMPGQELAMKVLQSEANSRVLFCSGYPLELEGLPQQIQGRVAVLQKPFLPNMLAGAVAELLKR